MAAEHDGSVDPTYTGSVTLRAYTDSNCQVDAPGALTAEQRSVRAVNGVARFAEVAYSRADTIYLRASAPGANTTCTPVAIQVGAPAAPAGISSLTVGGEFNCVVVNGGVRCWGDNSQGQLGANLQADASSRSTTPVEVKLANGSALSGTRSVSGGYQHACAVVNGGAYCWGDNGEGQLGDGTTIDRNVAVPVTGLTQGVVAVSAGEDHSCALMASGRIKCWGGNSAYQVGYNGNSSAERVSRPVDIVTDAGGTLLTGAIAVSTGRFFSCALLSNGQVGCWGANVYRQLGDSPDPLQADLTWPPVPFPIPVSGGQLVSMVSISAGGGHVCGVRSDGVAYCWGANDAGQMTQPAAIVAPGTPARETLQSRPAAPLLFPAQTFPESPSIQAVAAGWAHNCALARGGVLCWGDISQDRNDADTLTADAHHDPRAVPGLGFGSGAIAVATRENHACAIVRNEVRCWGSNAKGQLGASTPAKSLTPLVVPGLSVGTQALAAGSTHSCAATGGGVRCWGNNAAGMLGVRFEEPSKLDAPARVLPDTRGVQAIAAGGLQTCALSGGKVECWGTTSSGSASITSIGPTSYAALGTDATGIAVGENHSCAVFHGEARCWGHNARGQLGNDSVAFSASPVTVRGPDGSPLTRVKALALGAEHSCALLDTGRVSCWGGNSLGQLGVNSAQIPASPNGFSKVAVPVPGVQGARALALGGFHSCALLDSGAVRCWGDDTSGQLGQSAVAGGFTSTPILMTLDGSTSFADVVAVSAGASHTCLIDRLARIQCLGASDKGQTGTSPMSGPHTARDNGIQLVTSGFAHACALQEGRVVCWGGNDAGQLGTGGGFSSFSAALRAVFGL